MSTLRSAFAILVLAVIVCSVPVAFAAPVIKTAIAGSSAMWQTMALAAYNSGSCVSGGTAPCFHYTSGSNFNLVDTRPTALGGVNTTDTGAVWIVWDSAANTNIWVYIKVDSVVGNRFYFANPRCQISVPTFPSSGSQISSKLWGDS